MFDKYYIGLLPIRFTQKKIMKNLKKLMLNKLKIRCNVLFLQIIRGSTFSNKNCVHTLQFKEIAYSFIVLKH